MTPAKHRRLLSDRASFVACDSSGGIRGFVAAARDNGWLHIEEISVIPQAQGRGIGRQLIEAVLREARDSDASGISLTTYRDVPWNAPWYRKLGFVQQAENVMHDYLAARLREETESNLCPPERIAMVYPLP
jgi:GNAT superfamily N-acetyltransferase